MITENTTIAGTNCRIFRTEAEPELILIQPSARHEEKRDGVAREMRLMEQVAGVGFAMATFDTGEWARALMPWHDDAVARDEEVGLHAADTLRFILQTLLPWLRCMFGNLRCVIGGYSLGGLFALWAASETDAFCGVAAASPSLWVDGWADFAASHHIKAQCAYISLGDREEHCRNRRMKRIGDCVRAEHKLLLAQLGSAGTTLEWNSGGHFGEEAERTARAFAWCMNNIAVRQSNEC